MITDANYARAKTFCKDFETKNLGEYHDLYAQSDILGLADSFANFRNICFKKYKLYPAKDFLAPQSASQAAFKKAKL